MSIIRPRYRDTYSAEKESVVFWRASSEWPRDHDGLVFLARALHAVAAREIPNWEETTPWKINQEGTQRLFREAADLLAGKIADGHLGLVVQDENTGRIFRGAPVHIWNSSNVVMFVDQCSAEGRQLDWPSRDILPGARYWFFVEGADLKTIMSLGEAVSTKGSVLAADQISPIVAETVSLKAPIANTPRRASKRLTVQTALAEMYSGEIPTIEELDNATLVDRVQKFLSGKNRPIVSHDRNAQMHR